jgi:hypothetical protein
VSALQKRCWFAVCLGLIFACLSPLLLSVSQLSHDDSIGFGLLRAGMIASFPGFLLAWLMSGNIHTASLTVAFFANWVVAGLIAYGAWKLRRAQVG